MRAQTGVANPMNLNGASIEDVHAEGEGVSTKVDIVIKLSKEHCVNLGAGGGEGGRT